MIIYFKSSDLNETRATLIEEYLLIKVAFLNKIRFIMVANLFSFNLHLLI